MTLCSIHLTILSELYRWACWSRCWKKILVGALQTPWILFSASQPNHFAMTSERFQFQQFPSWFVCFRVLNKLCLGAEWGLIGETISLAVYFYRNRKEVRKNSETSIDFKIYLIMYRMVEVLHRKHLESKWHWLTSADAVNFIFDSTFLVHFSIDWIFNQVTQYECRQLFFDIVDI